MAIFEHKTITAFRKDDASCETNNALYPIDIRLYGTDAIVFQPNLIDNQIQQIQGLGVCPWGCRLLTHSRFLIRAKNNV